jgi:hypothetical protein
VRYLSIDTVRGQKVTGGSEVFLIIFADMLRKRLFAIILLMLSVTAVYGQTARALLVAIDKYPEGNGWGGIHATGDLELIAPMLAANGFGDGNIVALTNERATRAAIAEQLEKLSRDTRSGDRVYIHFSCHGQQMADTDGDEPDGLDEAIVPYDARRRWEAGRYEGENHLRDDELEAYLEKIRRRAGSHGNLVLVVDACHSGTADRIDDEETYIRGTAYIFAPPGFVATAINGSIPTTIRSDRKLATMTVISACQPDQINYEYRTPEGKYYGSLTYALCGTMTERNVMSHGDLRRELAGRIGRQNANRRRVQTPLLETSDEKGEFRIGR